MIEYPKIDAVAVDLGFIQIHWYGLMYLLGLAMAWWLLKRRADRHKGFNWNSDLLADLVFYCALGVIVGGRLGYTVFYALDQWLADPLFLFRLSNGGMSFHGGMIGVFVAMAWFARRHGQSFFTLSDYVAPAVPPALGLGRLGNFINTELPGRVTDVPWAFNYPGVIGARHPSSLYQMLLEGVVLFVLLWWYSAKPRPKAAVSAMFLLGYGSLRLLSELFREPDNSQFIIDGILTRGQLLSLPMVLIGGFMMFWAYQLQTTQLQKPQRQTRRMKKRKS